MSLDMALSCNEPGLFRLQLKLTGESGAEEEGAEDEEDTDGATVNDVLFEEVSGLSDFIRQSFSGTVTDPWEILVDLLAVLISGW